MQKVDPFNLPSRPMTKSELQYWILFTMAVAGKGAKVTERKMLAFLRDAGRPLMSPFRIVNMYTENGELLQRLKKQKLGKYTLLMKGFPAAAALDVQDDLDVEKLMKIPGIGPKGARMILLYARTDVQVAVLDTHILKWLRAQGYSAPKATPSGKQYLELERVVLEEARKRGMTAKIFDTWVWQSYVFPTTAS